MLLQPGATLCSCMPSDIHATTPSPLKHQWVVVALKTWSCGWGDMWSCIPSSRHAHHRVAGALKTCNYSREGGWEDTCSCIYRAGHATVEKRHFPRGTEKCISSRGMNHVCIFFSCDGTIKRQKSANISVAGSVDTILHVYLSEHPPLK